jgi:hypothetical protein
LRRLAIGAATLALLLLGACRWGYNFSGGGLPANIKTIAVMPFENRTPSAELPSGLTDRLRVGVERRLGLRGAPPRTADAIVRGTIVRYDLDIPVAFSADPSRATTARRRLVIVVDIEILDQKNNKVLWARQGLSAEGDYAEGAEAAGRDDALDRIVNDVIEGAQSQW